MKKAFIYILAIISVVIYYLINKYYFPPEINLQKSDIANSVLIETSLGKIKIKLKEDPTMASVQFTKLVREKFYDGVLFHYIVPNLLIEAGDPLTKYKEAKNFWGQGGSGSNFKINKYKGDKILEGTVVMTDTGGGVFGSHFAIITKDTPWMIGRAEVIGKVEEGIDIVKLIEKAETNTSGTPFWEIRITKITEL